jgi:hypothetical protein
MRQLCRASLDVIDDQAWLLKKSGSSQAALGQSAFGSVAETAIYQQLSFLRSDTKSHEAELLLHC